jgi:hypothetical protein
VSMDSCYENNFLSAQQEFSFLVFGLSYLRDDMMQVPNPLFDLAGIMCGQFLVPFWKFFLATLLGKALIKTHIQTVFIILVCNAHLLELIEAGLEWVILHVPIFAQFSSRIMSALGNAKDSFNGQVVAKGFLMEKQKQEMAALTELLSNTETERCQDSKDC